MCIRYVLISVAHVELIQKKVSSLDVGAEATVYGVDIITGTPVGAFREVLLSVCSVDFPEIKHLLRVTF